MTTNLNIVFGD